MKLYGIIEEDLINYKKVSMTLQCPYCTFKCNKEYGKKICHNSDLQKSKLREFDIENLIQRYLKNDLSEAIVFQGLEPFDSFDDIVKFIADFREVCNDDIVIYTGYNEDEVQFELDCLSCYQNIIVKFGRFIPYSKQIFDEVLGVKLASSNQYAKKIS